MEHRRKRWVVSCGVSVCAALALLACSEEEPARASCPPACPPTVGALAGASAAAGVSAAAGSGTSVAPAAGRAAAGGAAFPGGGSPAAPGGGAGAAALPSAGTAAAAAGSSAISAAAGSGAPAAGAAPLAGSGGAAVSMSAGASAPVPPGSTLPPIEDYSKNGPFTPMTKGNTGPDGMYTLVRPTNLGENGFKHPIATWGNGITTTPDLYPGLLNAFASHGFVVIASNSSTVTAAMLTAGLDWLIMQDQSGDMAGKLDVKRAVTIGYSLGGGAAVDAAKHPNVVATVSFHGLAGAAEAAQGPVFLMTSTADGFVTKEGYVMPCYARSSKQPTIMATLKVDASPSFEGHLYPLGDAGEERAPAIAWLRLWVYGDQGAKKYFYGDDCLLCKGDWTDIQRKNADWK